MESSLRLRQRIRDANFAFVMSGVYIQQILWYSWLQKQYSMICLWMDSLTGRDCDAGGGQSQQRGLNRASALFRCWTELYICTSPPPLLMSQRSRHARRAVMLCIHFFCCLLHWFPLTLVNFIYFKGRYVCWFNLLGLDNLRKIVICGVIHFYFRLWCACLFYKHFMFLITSCWLNF